MRSSSPLGRWAGRAKRRPGPASCRGPRGCGTPHHPGRRIQCRDWFGRRSISLSGGNPISERRIRGADAWRGCPRRVAHPRDAPAAWEEFAQARSASRRHQDPYRGTNDHLVEPQRGALGSSLRHGNFTGSAGVLISTRTTLVFYWPPCASARSATRMRSEPRGLRSELVAPRLGNRLQNLARPRTSRGHLMGAGAS
jgi:hypothetical protein